MAVVFQLRGTPLDAYRSFSGKTPGLFTNDSNGVAAVAVDGTSNTSPGAGNVKSGTTWVLNGVTQTGTLALGGGGRGHLGTQRIG